MALIHNKINVCTWEVMMRNLRADKTVRRVRTSRPISVDPGRWHPWDAMRAAMGDQLEIVAQMIGLSASYLEKWRLEPNPHDNGRGIPSPLARLNDFMEACYQARRPLDEVIAPLVWLAHKWGYEIVSRPRNVNGDKPYRLLSDMARYGGEAQARLTEFLDPRSRGGIHLTSEERRELLPLVEMYERNGRELRALVDVEAA